MIKKIVGPVFLPIFDKVYDPINVTDVTLTFCSSSFTSFLLIVIAGITQFMK